MISGSRARALALAGLLVWTAAMFGVQRPDRALADHIAAGRALEAQAAAGELSREAVGPAADAARRAFGGKMRGFALSVVGPGLVVLILLGRGGRRTSARGDG